MLDPAAGDGNSTRTSDALVLCWDSMELATTTDTDWGAEENRCVPFTLVTDRIVVYPLAA